MPRKLLVLFSLLLSASIASARVRAVAHPERKLDAAAAHGTITAVAGNLVSIAGGLITIDASNAKITVGRKHDATVADLKPGMLLFAAVGAPSGANAPLPATVIAATEIADAALAGQVDAVDTSARTLTLLGRTIRITDDTSFGGIVRDGTPGLDDVLPNQLVQVQTEAVGGQLVATSVTVLSPIPPQVATLRGTVKSIGATEWVITRDQGDTSVRIDAQTKIAGSPKVGDTVEVLYRVDAAHANIAIAIVKFERPTTPTIPVITRLTGRVKTIDSPAWVLTLEDNSEVKVSVERATIEPFIRAGDRVEVLAEKRPDGTYHAILIVKKR